MRAEHLPDNLPTRWHVRLHDGPEPLEAVWRGWDDTGRLTAFQRYDWVAAWCGTLGGPLGRGRATPLIVSVHAAPDAPPAMILPLARWRERGLRVTGFCDGRLADYCAPVLPPGETPAALDAERMMAAVLAALPPCDILRIHKMPPTVGGLPNPLLLWGAPARQPAAAYGLPIAAPFEAFSQAALPKSTLRTIRKATTALQRERKIGFEAATDAVRAPVLFDILLAQRRARFAELGRGDLLADPCVADFYRALAEGRFGRPIAAVAALKADEAMVATNFAVLHQGSYNQVLASFDMERWSRFAPGFLLNHRTMAWAAGNGIGFFDFTVGDEPYKFRFNVRETPLHEVVAPRSLRGLLPWAVWRAKVALRRFPALAARLKAFLKPLRPRSAPAGTAVAAGASAARPDVPIRDEAELEAAA